MCRTCELPTVLGWDAPALSSPLPDRSMSWQSQFSALRFTSAFTSQMSLALRRWHNLYMPSTEFTKLGAGCATRITRLGSLVTALQNRPIIDDLGAGNAYGYPTIPPPAKPLKLRFLKLIFSVLMNCHSLIKLVASFCLPALSPGSVRHS